MSDNEELARIRRKKIQDITRQKVPEPQNDGNGRPIVLTDQTFEETVSRQPLMVVDFWAAWCGPCRMVSPIIEQLAKEYVGKAAFGKVNVDENPVISNQFQIQSIPTLLILKNGRPVDGIIGAVPKQFIESKIKPYLAN